MECKVGDMVRCDVGFIGYTLPWRGRVIKREYDELTLDTEVDNSNTWSVGDYSIIVCKGCVGCTHGLKCVKEGHYGEC